MHLPVRAHLRVRRVVPLAVSALVASMLALGAAPSSAHEGHAGHDEASSETASQTASETAGAAAGVRLPMGFQDQVAISGLDQPTALAFASGGTAFLANQAGVVSTAAYSGGVFAAPTQFADLTASVMNYWDRGMVGIAVDPKFGQGVGRDYVYVSYTLNQDPRTGAFPAWGVGREGSPYYDDCPAPASASPMAVGCIATMRVSRLSAVRSGASWVMTGAEKVLVTGGCLQFPSHGSGALAFGPDGALYATFGEGASFDFADDGGVGNPCADPAQEGGSLRSQDIETSATDDPTSLDGTLIRIDPATGAPTTGSTGADDDAKRIVAYGLRNPWRLTFRPGTSEAWIGDVGAGGFDEVNRVTTLGSGGSVTKPNFGWPCYEGPAPNAQWQALEKPLCAGLYAAGTATAPQIAYPRDDEVAAGDGCPTGTSSVSGVTFVPTSGTSYPAAYQGRVVFSDFVRGCIWSAPLTAGGDVDRTRISLLAGESGAPVDLRTGPGGDIYYVDFGLDDQGVPQVGEGAVHRLTYSAGNQVPTAKISADKTEGASPLTVTLDASASSDPDGDALTYSWDLNGDGTYGDATGPQAGRTYTGSVNVTVGLRVSDGRGGVAAATQVISPGNLAPVIGPVTTGGEGWRVGQQVSFSATATDDTTLSASAYRWNLLIEHCPSICHAHTVTSYVGPSGLFTAPDHEYPSHLLLTLTVTDVRGVSSTRNVELDPATVTHAFTSSPPGAPLTIGTASTAPTERTFIVGSRFTASAAPTWTGAGGFIHQFTGWSDGGAVNHEINAPVAPTSYVAAYTQAAATGASGSTGTAGAGAVLLRLRTGPAKLKLRIDGDRLRSPWQGAYAVGSIVELDAPKEQWRRGHRWVFKKWTDRGRRSHTVTLPVGGLTIRAIYRRVR